MARKNLLRVELVIALLAAFALDRLTKWWALAVLRKEGTIQVIPNIFHLTFTINSGAAFSILSGKNAFLIFLSLCVILFIIYSYFRLPASRTTSIAVGLILGGAVSNLMDRFLLSGIVDFLDFRIWPIFNVADSAISIGVVLIIAYYAWDDFLKDSRLFSKRKA